MTTTELKILIEQLNKVFNKVRIVDVITTKTYFIGKNDELCIEPHACFAFWKKENRCHNCSSAKAYVKKGQVIKYEFVDSDVYIIVSKYIEVDSRPYIIEMVIKSNDDALFEAYGKNEFIERISSLNERLYLDSLTKAYNRNYYEEQLKGLTSKDDGVALLDVDNFKLINDTYGHIAGDIVLKKLVDIIRSLSRECDAVVRYGGDEFLIVFHKINEEAFIQRLHKIKDAVNSLKVTKEATVKPSISIGGVYCNQELQGDIVKQIDELLYQAKRKKNSIEYKALNEY